MEVKAILLTAVAVSCAVGVADFCSWLLELLDSLTFPW